MSPRTVSPARGRQSMTPSSRASVQQGGAPCFGSGISIAIGCAVAALSALIVASAQSGFFSAVRPMGTSPDLCLGFTVALGLLFGYRFGAVFGVASGFFIDAISADGFSLRIILYLLCGAAAGILAIPETRPIRDVWRFVSILASACGAKQVILALWVILTAPSVDMARVLTHLILREIVCTVLFSIPAYLISAGAFALYKRLTSSKKRLSGR